MIEGVVRKTIFAAAILGASTATAEKIKMTPQELLSRIHSANQEEIDAGQLALKKAHSLKVTKYGEQLVKDHAKADLLVTDLAKKENISLTTSPMPKSSEEAGQRAKHLATMAKLKALGSGPDFDKAFIEAMKDGHHDVIETLTNADTSDPKVKHLVSQLLPKLKSHESTASRLEPSVIKEAR